VGDGKLGPLRLPPGAERWGDIEEIPLLIPTAWLDKFTQRVVRYIEDNPSTRHFHWCRAHEYIGKTKCPKCWLKLAAEEVERG
jgi:hypothetical protein